MVGSLGEIVAIIPARGGSKGVVGKNLRAVGAVPLVARAIDSARSCQEIDRVVVTSDDAEIAKVASRYGAEVIMRPDELSSDEASSESALLHALGELGRRGVRVDILVFLQCTSPFIDPERLSDAVARIRSDSAASGAEDVVFSGIRSHGFLWRHGPHGVEGVNHDSSRRLRRQEMEPEFLETGAFYAMRAQGFVESRHRFFGRIGVVEVDERHAIEIDTEEQLRSANALAALVDVRFGELPDTEPTEVIDVDALVTDFDGVHTDDRVLVSETGQEFVVANRSDGMGVRLLAESGLPMLILSTEQNPVVTARATKLGVDVLQGLDDKAAALAGWAADRGILLDRIAYLGNDVNDLACMGLVGWPLAVADAHPLVRSSARVVLTRAGGDGAVREIAERLLLQRKDGASQ